MTGSDDRFYPRVFALVTAALLAVASRQPEVFSSAQGITLLDTPVEFNEFFGSMISMDDPRHARLRRIVSRGFTQIGRASCRERV